MLVKSPLVARSRTAFFQRWWIRDSRLWCSRNVMVARAEYLPSSQQKAIKLEWLVFSHALSKTAIATSRSTSCLHSPFSLEIKHFFAVLIAKEEIFKSIKNQNWFLLERPSQKFVNVLGRRRCNELIMRGTTRLNCISFHSWKGPMCLENDLKKHAICFLTECV